MLAHYRMRSLLLHTWRRINSRWPDLSEACVARGGIRTAGWLPPFGL